MNSKRVYFEEELLPQVCVELNRLSEYAEGELSMYEYADASIYEDFNAIANLSSYSRLGLHEALANLPELETLVGDVKTKAVLMNTTMDTGAWLDWYASLKEFRAQLKLVNVRASQVTPLQLKTLDYHEAIVHVGYDFYLGPAKDILIQMRQAGVLIVELFEEGDSELQGYLEHARRFRQSALVAAKKEPHRYSSKTPIEESFNKLEALELELEAFALLEGRG